MGERGDTKIGRMRLGDETRKATFEALTTEMFSFSESDFLDFFDFFFPLSFFFSPFSSGGAVSVDSGIDSIASLPDELLSIDLLLVTDAC